MTEQMRCFKDGRDAPLLPLLTKVKYYKVKLTLSSFTTHAHMQELD